MPEIETRILAADQIRHHLDDLSDILADCVPDGGVSFLLPFTSADARPFWQRVSETAASESLLVLGAFVDGVLAGSVQLVLVPMPNQPHRAEVAKLLVARRMRRKGVARKLMLALEAEAKIKAGIIPGYAMKPAGGFTATTIFYKNL